MMGTMADVAMDTMMDIMDEDTDMGTMTEDTGEGGITIEVMVTGMDIRDMDITVYVGMYTTVAAGQELCGTATGVGKI